VPTADADPDDSTDSTEFVRSAVFADGKVILQGRVVSQAIADEIIEKAGAVVGPDNVIVE